MTSGVAKCRKKIAWGYFGGPTVVPIHGQVDFSMGGHSLVGVGFGLELGWGHAAQHLHVPNPTQTQTQPKLKPNPNPIILCKCRFCDLGFLHMKKIRKI